MAGGLLQIVAYGAQDIYLTGNPQITFFKAVYRRHTNFSIESIKQTFNGTADFGQEVSTTIQRNADLIYKTYLEAKLPSISLKSSSTSEYKAFRWLNWIGHVLIKTAEVRIGGQKIDKHYGEWLHIWNELSQKYEKQAGYAEMVGNVPKLTQINSTNNSSTAINTGEYTLFIPLQFWFCKNPGLALPLIALQYHDIVINFEFRTLKECIWATSQTGPSTYASSTGSDVIGTTGNSLSNVNLYVDYIYLDVDERRRFSQVAHEYLIEQLQFTGEETLNTTTNLVKLNFTHPIKELIWVVQPTNFVNNDYTQSRAGHQYFNYTDLWDYTNFTGTPEPSSGPGMVGGKHSQNLFYGLPGVNVKGNLDLTNEWYNTNTTITSSNAGYNNVSNYTPDSNSNSYNNRDIGNLFVNYNNNSLWQLNNNKLSILDNGDNPVTSAKIVLNGNDRISEREGKYFNLIQPYQHHTNCPAPGINVYSFALTPEDHQPSGTCNFSKIDNAHLNVSLSANSISKFSDNGYNSGNVKIRVYAVNYNILRIMSGMGGLAYSN